MNSENPKFVYDQDCAFCQRFVDKMRAHCGDRVEFVGSQTYVGAGAEWTQRASILVFRDPARVCVGAEGIGELMKLSDSFGLRLLGRIIVAPGVSWAANIVYRWIAGHRHLTPAGCNSSTGSCSVR